MTLRRFIPAEAPADRSLILVNEAAPDPVRRMLGDLFDKQQVQVEERALPDYETNTVVLVEDGEVIASSPLAALQDSILIVNSDLFITGTRELEDIDVPEVIQGLEGVPFYLRGYPESNSEKLMLILISRFVERQAYETGTGTLRTSFQYLSRIEDEQGTRAVYEKLAESDVEVHVYGQPDWIPSRELPVTTHTGRSEDFKRAWFVLFEPDEAGAPFGLLAYETDPRRWQGFYTSDPGTLTEITDYIKQRL